MLHPLALIEALLLVSLANGTPVIAKKLLGGRFGAPLDGGVRFIDGRALLGPSKTVRGVVLAILVTVAGAVAIGLGAKVGAVAGATAMAGDLCSSFAKRRLGMAPHSMATGLDQIPESLFPLLACSGWLGLGAVDILVGVAAFLVGEVLVSRLLFRFNIRERPY